METTRTAAMILVLTVTLSGCVGLDPKNEGFGENAAEVGRRVLVGVMTLGISEGVLADERKQQRLNAAREANYRRWYDGLSDTEKNIEDMKEAHRYQLMGTIMHTRQMPTFHLTPSQQYSVPNNSSYDGTNQRRTSNCSSNMIGNQVNTTCY